MTSQRPIKLLLLAFVFAASVLASHAALAMTQADANGLKFEITLDESVADKPITGRVLVFLSTRNDQPMNGPNWFGPEPFYGVEVVEMQPGASITVGDDADGFPGKLSELPAGNYYVQAVLDHGFYQSSHANEEGNFHSEPVRIELDGQSGTAVQILLNKTLPSRDVEDTDWLKVVELESKLLEDFHKRPVVERAAVLLPASYAENPDKRYPVYYDVTGFSGTISMISSMNRRPPRAPQNGDAEFIKVYLTGQCKWGHHVYANSATNGPRGDTLVQEMIPLIDSTFRTIAEPTARFVGGHSSGGWSSLWLQVTYPDTFGGVWSTAPDPVDFRDFQQTDMYAEGATVFFDSEGNKRPLARNGETPMVWYPDFCKMDDVLGRGGQLRSFEAVFSPLDDDGLPKKCWDRETGKVNPEVAEYWKQYDIGLKLENNWTELAPKLEGKLHVYMGTLDTFYLEGATELLKVRMDNLGSDAKIELFEGKDHSSVMSRELRARISREMTELFRKHHPE